MSGGQRFVIPDGWFARGLRLEVEPTSPEQRSRIAQAFGGRRFAYNWGLAQVKANLEARERDPAVPPLQWDFYALRKQWNQAKHQVAPWWRCSSKEAYACGIADLVQALRNWQDAKQGRRAGRPVGFPRFKTRRRDRGRVRLTTGAMRLEPDRRHLTLPRIGRLHCKENARRLERLVAKGRARMLSMTLSEHGGRLYVSVQALVAHQPRVPSQPTGRCGIDLGIGAEWAVIAHEDGEIERVAHPAPWLAVQRQRRRLARQRSRRVVGSRAYCQASAKLAALDHRRRICAPTSSTPSLPGCRAATARSWSRTSTFRRWGVGWAAVRFAAASTKPGSAGSARCWPTSARSRAGGLRWPTASTRHRRPTMAAAATWPTCGWTRGCGCALGAGR
jgi:putative transposase